MDAKVIISTSLGIVIGFGLSQIIFKNQTNSPKTQSATKILESQQPESKKLALDVMPTGARNEHYQNQDIAQLKAQIIELKAQLIKANQIAIKATAEKNHIVHESEDAGETLVMPYSADQLAQLLDEPYSLMAENLTGYSVELFSELYKENAQYERDYVLEEKINDYIVLHELNAQLELHGVLCKQSVCEIKGKELEVYSWNRVLSAMQHTDWWAFRSSFSNARFVEGSGEHFYSLMAY